MLDLFRAGELGEDAGALDRTRSLKVISGVPGCLIRVVIGVVTGSHVNNGYFEDLGGITRKMVEELALRRVSEGGMLKDVGNGKSENWYRW